MNRENKIKILKAIAEGKVSAKEALMPKMAFYTRNKDGTYKVGILGNGPILTAEEFEAYKEKHPAKVNLIMTSDPRNEPIISDDGTISE